jgi:hypothetical protein
MIAANNTRAFCEIAQCEGLADWKADQTDSELERTRLLEKIANLRESSQKQQALAVASRALNGISQTTTAEARQASTRLDTATNLDTSLNGLAMAAQARQTAIENELRTLDTEKSQWTAYYGARSASVQTECAITGSEGEPVKAAPPKPTKKVR